MIKKLIAIPLVLFSALIHAGETEDKPMMGTKCADIFWLAGIAMQERQAKTKPDVILRYLLDYTDNLDNEIMYKELKHLVDTAYQVDYQISYEGSRIAEYLFTTHHFYQCFNAKEAD